MEIKRGNQYHSHGTTAHASHEDGMVPLHNPEDLVPCFHPDLPSNAQPDTPVNYTCEVSKVKLKLANISPYLDLKAPCYVFLRWLAFTERLDSF
jgi:hypothetical protein